MKKVIGVILVLGIIGLGSYFLLLKQEGFEFTVKNQTNKEITGLYLTYNHINSDIKIPSIQPGEETKLNVTPTEDFGENSMKLQYKDSKGKQHTEYVIGYFEKGYSGGGKITLESINKNGEIQMKIEDTTRLY
ncbi:MULTISPECIES: hypothetical protein [unclassified Peribacillus]|jgi:hypothetical protein|uniref:hypothetical protein n=1 Tax=unclassified Peribacillus TaxID=2675266 RepID=UPI0019114F60|nr:MULTISPECIES: hypothetical protein [unclassified Peribacillus]MBK5443485.1 hypothetical protein [Peribacillus sp. TH24]MBK5461781.1 hypothetical protein [Peribacillus sp. TH27]MBK5499934.1 hypothetical protein [Peribacillus sp. TH14]WMX55013.1 hypothetical protein RE409_23665 [Peribacillus sp. R9-11]